MRKITHILTLLLLMTGGPAIAQSCQGIYVSASDYADKKLSYTDSKISINHSVWTMPNITVGNTNGKTKLSKAAIFGYRDSKGNDYRFFGNDEYHILESATLTIYLHTERVSQGKGDKILKRYFFSLSPTGDIKPLTTDQLAAALSSNPRLMEQLSSYSGSVTDYDDYHKMYRINYWLLAKTIKTSF